MYQQISGMRSVKAVQFNHSEHLDSLLEAFRNMVNEAVRVALEQRITSRFKLIKTVYESFKRYGLHTHYILNACEVACGLIKNRRRKKTPYVRTAFLKLDNQTFKLENDTLRFPVKPRQLIEIPLKMGDYQRRFLSDPTLKLGSVTITEDTVTIAFSKTVEAIEPKGYVAIDTNERSLDCATSKGELFKYDLRELPRIHHTYFEKRRAIQRRFWGDRRKSQRLQAKYHEREKHRTEQLIHRVSKDVVERAKENGFGIILEQLKNIRRKANQKVKYSKRRKRRLNTWSFRKLQDLIEYKAEWEGISVIYVNPKDTSQTCPICGCKQKPNGQLFTCSNCGWKMDKQTNASINILKTQDDRVRFTLDSPSHVAVTRPLNKAVSKSGEGTSSGEDETRTPT